MITPVLTALFSAVYFIVTIWLCRGVKLNAKALSLSLIHISQLFSAHSGG